MEYYFFKRIVFIFINKIILIGVRMLKIDYLRYVKFLIVFYLNELFVNLRFFYCIIYIILYVDCL